MPQAALLWFVFHDATGKDWRVYLAPGTHKALAPSTPRGTPNIGRTLRLERAIYIDAGQNRADQDVTLLHELMHAALTQDSSLSERTEEMAVEALDSPLLSILQHTGWRPPRRPAGTAALERESRKGSPCPGAQTLSTP